MTPPAPHLQTAADRCHGPVICGVNEAGMLLQSQDKAVRAAEAPAPGARLASSSGEAAGSQEELRAPGHTLVTAAPSVLIHFLMCKPLCDNELLL